MLFIWIILSFWSQVGRDTLHSRFNPYCLPIDSPQIEWQLNLEISLLNEAIIDEDKIYVASEAGLYVISKQGEVLFFFSGDIKEAPAVGESLIYFISDTVVYALGKEDYQVHFHYSLDNEVTSSLLLSSTSVFMVTTEGRLYACSKDLTPLWTVNVPFGNDRSTPALKNDTLVIGTLGNLIHWSAGYVSAYSASSGDSLWRFNLGFFRGDGIRSDISILPQGEVVFATYADIGWGFSYFFKVSEGASLCYKWLFFDHFYSDPAFRGDTVFLGTKAGLIKFLPDCNIEWTYPVGEVTYSSPAIDGEGNIYIGNDQGELYSVSLEGELNWILPLSDSALGKISLADSFLIVSSADGFIHLIGNRGTNVRERYLDRSDNSSIRLLYPSTLLISSKSYFRLLKIYRIDGSLIGEYLIAPNQSKIILPRLPQGIYFYLIKERKRVFKGKFLFWAP